MGWMAEGVGWEGWGMEGGEVVEREEGMGHKRKK